MVNGAIVSEVQKNIWFGGPEYCYKDKEYEYPKKLHQDLGVVIQVCSPLARHVLSLCQKKKKKRKKNCIEEFWKTLPMITYDVI